MNLKEAKETIELARRVTKEAVTKKREADEAMKQMGLFAEKLKGQRKFLETERVALEGWRKRLKYAELKINKILKDRQIDEEIRELIKYDGGAQ